MIRTWLLLLAVAAMALQNPVSATATLLQSFQQTGQIDLEVVGAATSNPPAGQPISGNFTINNAMPGSVVKATFYAADWNNAGAPLDLSFGGLPPIPPTANSFSTDATGITQTMYAYQWDVTSIVNTLGPSIYGYTLGSNGNTAAVSGLMLSVVYNTNGPTKQVTIFDGATQVAENSTAETESITLSNMAAGPTDLSVFTVFDDSGGTGEQVKYNGAVVGGPLDNALGFNATLLTGMTGTSVASPATNQLDMVSSSGPGLLTDHFGWLYAAAVVTPNVVPEPSTIIMGGVGLLLLIATGLRSRRLRR